MNRMVVVVLDSEGKAYAFVVRSSDGSSDVKQEDPGLAPWRALLAAPWRAS